MNDIVYHYTSPSGVYNILKEKTLWFTDCQYLNDVGEFVYIRKPFREAYKKIAKERGEANENLYDFIESFFASPYEDMGIIAIDNQLPTNKSIGFKYHRYYVLCTSINSDTASLWNYYVKNGMYQGYNLGIDRHIVKEWFARLCYTNKQIDFMDGKVIYDKNKQIQMIYSKLKELLTKYDERENQIGGNWQLHDSNIESFQEGLYDYIQQWKLFFKTPAFSSEEEYRFVLKVDNAFNANEDLSLKYRVGESGIITPYIEWAYALDGKRKLFKQITLAPMIESSLAKESFKRFLDTEVRQNIEIVQSSIRVRF